jgi:hypothetical protein
VKQAYSELTLPMALLHESEGVVAEEAEVAKFFCYEKEHHDPPHPHLHPQLETV